MTPPGHVLAGVPVRDREMYAAGQASVQLDSDVFVPVPVRWRHVQPADVVLDPDGRPWMLTDRTMSGDIEITRGAHRRTADPDPDEVVSVLIPVGERDAVELTREQLGARLIERRTA